MFLCLGYDAAQQVNLNITFEEAARGVQKTFNVNVIDACEKCKGSGVELGYKKVIHYTLDLSIPII